MTEGPLLWFLNRSTGLVALVLLTAATVLGVLALGGRPGTRVPRFVVQSVHRNVALLAVVTVAVHVLSSVVDEFVDIRWWHALVPFTGDHERVWLGLGAVAVDLLLVVTVTSLLRHRMRRRTWHALHLSVYPLWLTSILHGAGMGTDLGAGLWWVTLCCAAAVAAAVAWRLVRASKTEDDPTDPVRDGMTMPLRRSP
ncbi:ferric reductase-like transmembrane domain-containing protein [Nocardioides sp. GXQ0305]|uniref:ferric reductase-like transmembrane domain-containing protein n=1 Tax=Nocardioides sp. GXQ0305 TaxID=3423912 RepID=UPI003D7CF405